MPSFNEVVNLSPVSQKIVAWHKEKAYIRSLEGDEGNLFHPLVREGCRVSSGVS